MAGNEGDWESVVENHKAITAANTGKAEKRNRDYRQRPPVTPPGWPMHRAARPESSQEESFPLGDGLVRLLESSPLPPQLGQQRGSPNENVYGFAGRAAQASPLDPSADLKEYLGERVTKRSIAELVLAMEALKSDQLRKGEPLRKVIDLPTTGPFYQSPNGTLHDFGLEPPIIGFVSVLGSREIWTALQMPLLNGNPHTFPPVAMTQIGITDGRFDPHEPIGFNVGGKGNIKFLSTEGDFLDVGFNVGPGTLRLKTYEDTGLYVLANPEARVLRR